MVPSSASWSLVGKHSELVENIKAHLVPWGLCIARREKRVEIGQPATHETTAQRKVCMVKAPSEKKKSRRMECGQDDVCLTGAKTTRERKEIGQTEGGGEGVWSANL